MAKETLVEQFHRLWKETLPGTSVPPPTNQQLLGVALVFLDHAEGAQLWNRMNQVVDEAFPYLGEKGRRQWVEDQKEDT